MTKEQWERIKELLPPERAGKRGRPRKDDRKMLNGMLWIVRSGTQWRELPEAYGPWQSVYARFAKWRDDGTLEAIFRVLSADADMENLSLDSTSIDTLEQEREEAAAKRRRKEEEAEAERQRLLAEEERRRKEAEAEAEAKRKRKEAEAAAARRAKIAALEAEEASIRAELHNIKGLFSGGKRRELEARLVKIGGELQQL